MDSDLQPLHSLVMEAQFPEDLFGSTGLVLPAAILLKDLERQYTQFKKLSNPGQYQDPLDVEAARDTDEKLERLYAQARARIDNGSYGIEGYGGLRPPHASRSFEVGRNRYYIGRQLNEAEPFRLYEGFLEREGMFLGEVVIKVVSDPGDNNLARNEARNLDVLHSEDVPQWKHLPYLLDRFESGGRVGLVLRKLPGFTLTEVRRHRLHQNGIDQKHMVWVMDRMLSCLGYVHRLGLVHGALHPAELLIQPRSHNVIVDGWCHAVHRPAVSGERAAINPGPFTAPEVLTSGQVGPWSDIYSLGRLMIWILGGDPERDSIPAGVEPPLRDFLLRLTTRDSSARPDDAWLLHAEQGRIKDALWPRKFLHFEMN